ASIDTETEQLIQEGLQRLMQGRTSILIAHRLQTIQEADHVMVLELGKVREYGTHQALIAQGGLYKKLHDLQFQEL
ncbi:MAG: lipid ABC transporter permease/ATP-binding protein, partial [Pseudomonadales bacterium]|nr:lipid ABC transporter permease/ATP-binding protein [Pseudomonadales bacterium]